MLNNQDFTANRQNFLGGSDIAAILGLSPFRTAVDVWLEKTGKATNQLDSLALRFGSFAESFIASEYEKATGFITLEHQPAIIHPNHQYLQAHIDRVVATKPKADLAQQDLADDGLDDIFPPASTTDHSPLGASRLLECKTANPFYQHDWGEPGTDAVPLHYLCQCAWYLALTQAEQIDLAVLFGNTDFRIYHIARDAQLESDLLEHAINFWQNHVLADQPPAAKNQEDYKRLFAKESPTQTRQASANILHQLSTYPNLVDQAKAIETQIDAVKQAVMEEMQHADTLVDQGRTLATWRSPKSSSRFDQKSFEKAHPDLYQQYQVTIENSRRLIIK
jgi:putative phage-type endonuclease